ncbi:MAG TPA: hypothetical protein VJT49_22790 [Amycolatopsis sp.]|uniref:hypothetical protein n=1 Tax=Amycolatopsis sp. TaxID=37632 RepID=UPI002B46DE18|nr:hypothetical protein [Amycolatopsis sp.]HKS47885.1 hypothetical protein [Amycolatopsis sp.]
MKPALFATVYRDDEAEGGKAALDKYCQANCGRPLGIVGKIQAMMAGPDLEAGAEHILLRIVAVEPSVFEEQSAGVAELARVRVARG